MIDGKFSPAYYGGRKTGGGIANMYSKKPLELENGILKDVGSNESDDFACLFTISFPWIPI